MHRVIESHRVKWPRHLALGLQWLQWTEFRSNGGGVYLGYKWLWFCAFYFTHHQFVCSSHRIIIINNAYQKKPRHSDTFDRTIDNRKFVCAAWSLNTYSLYIEQTSVVYTPPPSVLFSLEAISSHSTSNDILLWQLKALHRNPAIISAYYDFQPFRFEVSLELEQFQSASNLFFLAVWSVAENRYATIKWHKH